MTFPDAQHPGTAQPRRFWQGLPLLALTVPLVGGQAVMEGVMMRNGPRYALAVRRPGGDICLEEHPWFCLTDNPVLGKPLVRGFPALIETLVNGIHALNRSAVLAEEGEGGRDEPGRLSIFFTVLVSLLLAVGLFVVLPHLLSFFMKELHLGGDVEGLSFHLWDGFFKFFIFIAYIQLISLLPEIRRVFCYHGAEHKTIHALEREDEISARSAARCSRLHPRCGTTFLLFVLCIAILVHALLVPPLLQAWQPESAWLKHAGSILFKLALMLPISALAYELIRLSARCGASAGGRLLRAPGMFLQLLTTREPSLPQLEVAVAALGAALADEAPDQLQMPASAHFGVESASVQSISELPRSSWRR